MTISPALFPAVTVTVVRDRRIRTVLRTNQIAGFVQILLDHMTSSIWILDLNFIFSWQKQYFTQSLRSFVKYCFPLENKIHIFAPPCNILYLFFPRGHGNESCNLIGSQRGPDFPISDQGHGNGGKQRGWNCHVQLVSWMNYRWTSIFSVLHFHGRLINGSFSLFTFKLQGRSL